MCVFIKKQNNSTITFVLRLDIPNQLRENLVRNTTCSEQMVYSAIETTCFGLYLPSSGFYNIDEESINAVKTVRGLLMKRSLYQSPDHSVPSARAI